MALDATVQVDSACDVRNLLACPTSLDSSPPIAEEAAVVGVAAVRTETLHVGDSGAMGSGRVEQQATCSPHSLNTALGDVPGCAVPVLSRIAPRVRAVPFLALGSGTVALAVLVAKTSL